MSQSAAYVAMMVIAETPDRTGRLAIFVGTDKEPGTNPPGQWLVGFADADEAESWFSQGGAPSDPAVQTIFDAVPPFALLKKWFDVDSVGVSDGSGAELKARMTPVAGPTAKTELWIDHVVRLHFFDAAKPFFFGQAPPQPLARLDTAGFVRNEKGEYVDDPTWVVSRVRLDAAVSWADFETRPHTQTVLTGYWVVGHLPVAVNAHHWVDETAGKAKRFDTRVVLFAKAAARGQPGGLWSPAEPGDPAGTRPPAFRALDLCFSNADGLTPSEPVVTTNPRGRIYALTSLLGDDSAHCTDRTSAGIAPLFADVQGFEKDAPANLIAVRRQTGFRRIGNDPRLVFRAELHLALEKIGHWTPLWDGLAGPATGLERPDGLRVGQSSPCLLLAQEQVLEDLTTSFGGTEAAEWRITARVEQNSVGPSIERLLTRSLDIAQGYAIDPLRALRPESGMSTIPSIELDGQTPLSWYAVGGFEPRSTDRRIHLDIEPLWESAGPIGETLQLRSFQPVRAEDLWRRVPKWPRRPVKPTLSTIIRIDGDHLSLASAPIAVLEPIGSDTGTGSKSRNPSYPPSPEDGVRFQLSGALAATPKEQRIRIGALQFDLPASSSFAQTFQLEFDRTADRAPKRLALETHFSVKSAVPIEQDRLGGRRRRGESLASPVLIRLGDAIAAQDPLGLVGTETFGAHADQQVEWRFRGSQKPTSGKLLVIDPQPFRVAAVDYSFQPSADDSEIALWRRGDDGAFAWRIRDPEETVRMLLPPQIIGEAMERNIDAANPGLADIAPGGAAAARFGSLTRIDFDPTYRETGTREPSWNLKRVFDRIADAAPGALVRDLRFEIAYGLIARHQPQRETWLAEMSGIMGAAPDALDDDGIATRFIEHGNTVMALADHRLAVDKVWAGRPELRFETTEGLTFALRTKDDGNGPRTPFRYPVERGYPTMEDTPGRLRLRKAFADPQSDVAGSFAGGVAWAFQSANILAEVYAQPVSNEGRISDLFFSALGGWGQQRAAFAQGKSIIETETAMGRLSAYKLERLGRIGALGHRAKHVIVYRRTVAPSAQFFNRPPIGIKQDEHAGRPILRKVEEYVDILEPERHYPEKGTSTREPGCLSGARFVSRRVRVDSDWGGDVRNEGWMVPLWRADMANTNSKDDPGDPDSPANLYPKPLVQLLMPGEDGNDTPIAIDTPERLVFYTSTVDGETAATIDDWHAVEGIDFCDAPPPRVETIDPASSALHDGMLPPAPRSAGGHDRLTLALVEGQVPIRIGAGRTETSPAAPLKNVTISRARPRAVPGKESTQPRDDAHRAGDEAGTLAATMRARLDRLFGEVAARFEALGREALGGRERALKAVDLTREELKEKLRKLHTDLTTDAEDLTEKLGKVVPDLQALPDKAVQSLREELGKERARLKDRALGAISLAAADLIVRANEVTSDWSAELDAAIADWERVVVAQPIAQLRDRARRLLEKDLDPPLAALQADVLHANDEIASLLAQLSPTFDRITRLLDLRPELDDARREIVAVFVAAKASIAKARKDVSQWQPFGDPADVDDKKAEVRAFIASARQMTRALASRLQALATAPGFRPRHDSNAPVPIPPPPKPPVDDLTPIQEAIALTRELDLLLIDLDEEAKKFPCPPAEFALLLQRLDTLMGGLEDGAGTARQKVEGLILAAIDADAELLEAFEALVDQLQTDCWTQALKPIADAAKEAAKVIETARTAAKAFLEAGDTATQEVVDAAHALAATLEADVADIIRQASTTAQEAIQKVEADMRTGIVAVDSQLGETIDEVAKAAHIYLTDIGTAIAPAAQVVAKLGQQIAGPLDDIADAEAAIEAQIDAFANALIATINSVADEIDKVRAAIDQAVADQARDISSRVETYLRGVERDLARELGVQPGDIIDGVATAADKARYLYQEGDNVLRLIRAVGDPPKTDTLGFNRPEVAYVFDVLKPIVDVTPVVALANRVTDTAAAVGQAADAAGKLLESFGVRLPVSGFGEDLVPDKLKDLSLGKLFPDFAGLNLESLLKNAGFPDLSGKESQGVKITRGFDKDRREAWLAAEIDVKLSKSASILDIGPIALTIDGGQFRAQSRIAMGADGRVEKEAKGQIAGDWRLVTAGMDVITFEKTPLLFDKSGKIDFKIATDRVRLAPTLEFLTNLMAKIGKAMPAGVEPIMRDGMPAGLITKLSMQLPPVQTGAFAITDLSLAASFGIIAVPEFEIVASLDVASRDAPFTLARSGCSTAAVT